ncbi:hypothetical protein LP416_31040 [Polaromonas sp. P2-4]|nr:hypothetical protein LP416_31040 [Polaromonas sp. P2-4]
MSANETVEALLVVIKRFMKWIGIGILIVVAIGVLFGLYDHLSEYWQNKPYALTKYADVALGMSKEEVAYTKGIPKQVIGNLIVDKPTGRQYHDVISVDKIEKGKEVKDFSQWSYEISGLSYLDVVFDEKTKKVKSIICYSSDDSFSCTSVFGLHNGSYEKAVKERLSAPDLETIEGDIKIMPYKRFNLTLYLEQMKVYQFVVSKDAWEMSATSVRCPMKYQRDDSSPFVQIVIEYYPCSMPSAR